MVACDPAIIRVPIRTRVLFAQYVKNQAGAPAARHRDRRLPRDSPAFFRWVRRGVSGHRSRRPAGRHQGVPAVFPGGACSGRVAAQGTTRKAVALPTGAQKLLRRRALAGSDLARLRGERAQFLPRERNRLHGDELPGGRDPAGLHHYRERPQDAEGVPRVHDPLVV